jgi:flagellar motor switch protein FliN/FliY
MEPIMGKNSNEARPGSGEEFSDGAANTQLDNRNIEFLLDIPLNVSVEVGRSKILIKDLMQMREGYVIELDKLAGEPLDLYINSRLIARGEAVLVNEKFGLRLIDVVSPAERIEKLG